MNEHQYNVVQFLEAPYKEIADYVCVPRSWVQTRGPVDPKVKVTYPDGDPVATERKVKKRNKKSDQWKSYLSVVKYGTDSYCDAKRYIQQLLDNEDEKTLKSSRNPTPSAKMNMMESLRLIPTPKNKNKSANITAQKRKALPDSDKEAHNKRSKVSKPNDIVDEIAGSSIQAFELMSENHSLSHAMSNEDPCKQEASVTEENPAVYDNLSESKHFVDSKTIVMQEIFGEFCRGELRELQTNLQAYVTSLFTKTMKKMLRYVYISQNSPQEGPTLNEMQPQAKDDDDDDDQPLKKISSQKRINKVVSLQEYDENDSRWTLKYREPAPGLVELIKHSGVYVNAERLAECKKLSNNCQTLAQMLLSEIFTTDALKVCGLGNDFGIDSIHEGPELDTRATITLLKFVAEYGLEQDWEVCDYNCMLNGIRKNLTIMKTIEENQEGKKERGGHSKSTTISKYPHKRRFVLPPDYNKNDSRWTLKYREPAPGLVELRKHSGVYVNALSLANCKRLSRDCKTLARMLLTEIFTRSALSTCSWTGARAKAFDQDGTNVRPGLDEQARTVLLNYVADRAKKEGWNNKIVITKLF